MPVSCELSPRKGHGEVRVAHNLRNHVPAHLWESMAGTDFWLVGGGADIIATGAADVAGGLSGFGWTTTTLSLTAATGGDFLASDAAFTPPGISFGADTDLLQSPTIFGDYSHGLLAGQFLGRLPTKLVVEIYAAFVTNSANNETRTGFGLTEAGGTSGTANDAMAWITDDGTNFVCRSGADSSTGAADDALYHLFRIEVSQGTTDAIEWFIDGASQGTLDNQVDLWPASFGGYSSTTNRINLCWSHIWYE